jgi:hypothetical protein
MTGGEFEIRQTHVFYKCKATHIILEELKVDSFKNNYPSVSTVTKSTQLSGNKNPGESKQFYFTGCSTHPSHFPREKKDNECPFIFNKNTWYRGKSA